MDAMKRATLVHEPHVVSEWLDDGGIMYLALYLASVFAILSVAKSYRQD